MSNQAVIDAYLGAHHDTDLGDDSLLERRGREEMADEVAAEEAEREEQDEVTEQTQTRPRGAAARRGGHRGQGPRRRLPARA